MLLSILGGHGCVPADTGGARVQFAVWGSPEQLKVEQQIVAAFHQHHPEILVDLMVFPANRYAEKVQSMFVARAAPDAMLVNITTYRDWVGRAVLADLTAEARDLQHRYGEFMPTAARAMSVDGRMYALPVNAHGRVTYVNWDALDAAGVSFAEDGLTWDFVEEVAARLARRGGSPSAPVEYALLVPDPLPLLWEFGGELFDCSVSPAEVEVNSPETRNFFRFVRRVLGGPYAVPRGTVSDHGAVQLFRDGKVAFYFSGRWDVPNLQGRTAFTWDVAPFPAGPAGRITVHLGTGVAVSRETRVPEEARRFAAFYASAEAARIGMQGGRMVPVYRKMAESGEFLATRPPESPQRFVETMEAGASRWVLYAPGAEEVRRIFGASVERALARPDVPVEAIVSDLETELRRWLVRQHRR